MQNLGKKKKKKISDEINFAADFFFSTVSEQQSQQVPAVERFSRAVVLVHSGNMRELETVAGDGRWCFRQTTG